MLLKPIADGVPRVPLRHIILALALGSAAGAALWLWSQSFPVDFSSTALLSYETPRAFLEHQGAIETPVTDTDPPTVQIADSVLTPAVLLRLADQLHFEDHVPAGGVETGMLENNATQSARAINFRSHFEIFQPAPGLLQVTYRSSDGNQAVVATNAIAGALASWAPKQGAFEKQSPPITAPSVPVVGSNLAKAADVDVSASPAAARTIHEAPSKAEKHASSEILRRIAILEENAATMAVQQQAIERQIHALTSEEKSLKRTLQPFPADDSLAASRERLATVVKQLGQLRVLRLTVETENNAQRKEIKELKARPNAELESTLAPATDPLPVPTQAVIAQGAVNSANPAAAASVPALAAANQGVFTVVAWGDKPIRRDDDLRVTLHWSSGIGGILIAAIYLALIAMHFRSVSDLAALRRSLPDGARYFGAVSGATLTEKSL